MMGCCASPAMDNPAWQYAAARNALYAAGKLIELLACYEPRLRALRRVVEAAVTARARARTGKGVFPASVEFTADLHSMGQYIQEGAPEPV